MVELEKSKESLKIEPGSQENASPLSLPESSSSASPSPPAGSHYHHNNNVHSNHSNPVSPIPSTVTAPSSFPSAQKEVKNNVEEKVILPPRPLSRKNMIAATPPPGPIIYIQKENEFGSNFKILPVSDQIRELQTIIRDKNTTRSDFKFYADRLIRLVIEESLNLLPFRPHQVITPTGAMYDGLKYERGNCGVSIVRSGESMEAGLRDCCRSIRIGKILVESDVDTHEAHVVYARFPDDISKRKVILMYPIMSTGNTVIKSVNVLKEHVVPEENIILANLFCTPYAVGSVLSAFPKMKILTSEIHPVSPTHFGRKYFGTD